MLSRAGGLAAEHAQHPAVERDATERCDDAGDIAQAVSQTGVGKLQLALAESGCVASRLDEGACQDHRVHDLYLPCRIGSFESIQVPPLSAAEPARCQARIETIQ